ncbi:thioesterase II family protein [Paractinoplanes brasiliensis]|uniref:Pyochelin biosynthetic protein PchC n=1 Tax=Paractinoplanes brasiliensis TaxID=52695 RepID=A0A4R6K1M4_9ACTN|nr:alpha/beta fold hydrolase [Actinoplanes brasiliensis]TDO42011.1 pyochelin biosynthetic protein PchC [Actinoplanes brasiliensis]GID33112.1 thioesterase [Actinoplanes brasiliensis]
MITDGLRSSDRWLRPAPCSTVAGRRLVCLPHAGGTANAYRTWQDGLPVGTIVHAVQYPGRQDRLREPPATSVEQLAGPIADALGPLAGSPLVLFGHSMGAVVAYEVTLELERRHGPVVDLLIVSGSRAPDQRETGDKHLLTDQELAAEIARGDESFGELARDPELLGLVLPAIRADYRLLAGYRRGAVAVGAPIVAFGGVDDPEVNRAELAAWSGFTRAGFGLRDFPGGHFYLTDEPPILAALAEVLSTSTTPTVRV